MSYATREKTEFGTEVFNIYMGGILVDTFEVKDKEEVHITHNVDGKSVIEFFDKGGRRILSWAVSKVERIVLPTGIGGLATQLDGQSTSQSQEEESPKLPLSIKSG